MIDFKLTDWDKIKVGLAKYTFIMDKFHNCNVYLDKEFQTKFNGFYRIRRNQIWRDSFYKLLEENKNNNISFEDVLIHFYKNFGSIEASFSSKLVATINPNLPVWDSEVLDRLQINTPKAHLSKDIRLKKTIEIYNEIKRWYENYDKYDKKIICDEFDKHMGETYLTDTKKVDLILWQTRD